MGRYAGGYYGGRSSSNGGGGYGRSSGPYGGGRSSTGVYTASGAPVRNVAAYAATGAPTFTGAGSTIRNPTAYAGAVEGAMRQTSSAPKHLYHYTDSDSLSKIASSGKINKSTGPGDCVLGEGVYLTAKTPNCSSKNLLANNYDGAVGSATRVEGYVRVDADKVQARSGQDELGRNVWVVPGNLDLGSANAKLSTR